MTKTVIVSQKMFRFIVLCCGTHLSLPESKQATPAMQLSDSSIFNLPRA
jgi:hypothetical protein